MLFLIIPKIQFAFLAASTHFKPIDIFLDYNCSVEMGIFYIWH